MLSLFFLGNGGRPDFLPAAAFSCVVVAEGFFGFFFGWVCAGGGSPLTTPCQGIATETSLQGKVSKEVHMAMVFLPVSPTLGSSCFHM